MEEFKPGDLVRLKSSDPKMTISTISRDAEPNKKWYVCILVKMN